MITLKKILEFAELKDACEAQLNAFKSFLKSGDELSAWQTVLGNIGWLKINGLKIDQYLVEEKAQGIGITWYSNGQQMSSCEYKDGKANGLYQKWFEDGPLEISLLCKEGNIVLY